MFTRRLEYNRVITAHISCWRPWKCSVFGGIVSKNGIWPSFVRLPSLVEGIGKHLCGFGFLAFGVSNESATINLNLWASLALINDFTLSFA